MLGAVSNSYKIGSYVFDSVQQRTTDVIQSALHQNRKYERKKTNATDRIVVIRFQFSQEFTQMH